jgi:hypothetical protein
MTGLKVGIVGNLTMSSRAGLTIIGWMVTLMRASGRAARAMARMSFTDSRTAFALVRFKRTPPTSDLCTMSGDRILATTASLRARNGAANATASSASRAKNAGTMGMP